MELSEYQKNFVDFAINGVGHGVGTGVAGCGKTFILEQVVNSIYRKYGSILVMAFNRDIVKVLESRFKNLMNVTASSFHSFGLKQLTKNYGRMNVKTEYVNYLLDSFDATALQKGMNKEEYKQKINLRSNIRKMVSLSKATLIDYTDLSEVEKLADTYSVDVNGDFANLFNILPSVMNKCLNSYQIDFDDMIWRPVVNKINVQKFDFILVDEWQDMNKAQFELSLMALKDTGRIIVVGDERQSIYGFRGANVHSMADFTDRMNATKLPLSITYRCPKTHVENINQMFPEYPFESAPNAIDGKIENIEAKQLTNLAKTGDLVLCRKNAPLVNYAFSLIRNGKKAVIRGRDIGQGLSSLIDKMKSTNIPQLFEKLKEYEDQEASKLIASKKAVKLQNLQDKITTIQAIAENCHSIEDIHNKIDQIFSDDTIGVVLSSVHRAKGLESDNVFILEPENMPLPRVLRDGSPDDITQEYNIKIVAYTRSKENLYIVNTDSKQTEQMELENQ